MRLPRIMFFSGELCVAVAGLVVIILRGIFQIDILPWSARFALLLGGATLMWAGRKMES
jgi:hypothetical protein